METNKLKVSLKNIAMLKQEIRNFNVNGTGFVQMIRTIFFNEMAGHQQLFCTCCSENTNTNFQMAHRATAAAR